jgi:hypothetical protein
MKKLLAALLFFASFATAQGTDALLTEPSQLELIFGEIGQEGLDNFFAVSKRVSELLVVETYPLFSRG